MEKQRADSARKNGIAQANARAIAASASFSLLLCISTRETLAAPVAAPLSPDAQKVYEDKVKPFLETHCVKCHNEKKTLGGFRIDNLSTDFLEGKTADHWKEIIDNINLGKMPKRSEPRPDPKKAFAVVEWVAQELRNAEKRAKNSSGRIPTRRLNRSELVNTLRDLFHLEEKFARDLEEKLPMDGTLEGFDRAGAGLYIDEAQLEKYLEIADQVLSHEVFGLETKTVTKKYLARDFRWNNLKEENNSTTLPAWHIDHKNARAREMVKLPFGPAGIELKNGGVEYLTGGPLGWLQGPFFINVPRGGNWFGSDDPISSPKFQEGWYRLKFRAGAFKGTGKGAVDDVKLSFLYAKNLPIEAKETLVIDAPLDKPRDYEIRVYLRAGTPETNRGYNLSWNGRIDVINFDPEYGKILKEHTRLVYLRMELKNQKKPQAEIDAVARKIEENHQQYHETVLALKTAYVYNPEIDLKTIPRLRLESYTIEGPLGTWPPKGRSELFFAGEQRTIDKKYIREIFARFLPRAYRRPVESQEIDEVVAWVLKNQQVNKLSGIEAVKEGVKVVLCSPGFLLLQEPTGEANKPRQLNDYELASRLSYFLWSTMPDNELFELAANNKLHEPKMLTAQVGRMLADPRAESLARNFVGQWLKVREFPNVITDRRYYTSYDNELRDSSGREPYEFFKEVLDKDLSILNFVDSDFLVIDERLAKHYGIEGVKGEEFRKVAIRPEHSRGGVLGMAGVLTYLSDGIRTLPVRRAAYVLETLWNSPPPPPPPNAANFRTVGKNLTVRQRLDQHRDEPMCASCHARIDPYGMALENYDAIGRWRDRQNGEGFRGDKGSPLLDVSGVLPDKRKKESEWRKFKNLQEFKQALLAEKERFVRGFTEKMLTYTLGRPVGVMDRETIDEIIKTLERDDYRLQSLVQAIVASQVFQMK